jgi:hypothetical protein
VVVLNDNVATEIFIGLGVHAEYGTMPIDGERLCGGDFCIAMLWPVPAFECRESA